MEILIFIIFIVLIVLFISILKLKSNIKSLKKRFDQLEKVFLDKKEEDVASAKEQASYPESSSVADDLKPPFTEDTQSSLPLNIPQDKPVLNIPPKNRKQGKKAVNLFKKFEHVFIERWIAIIAVLILVAGISFLGVWASTRISPESRFALIVLAAVFLGGLSWFAGKYKSFQALSVWLRSSAAAVFLFATLGAGGIPGIQWIESPVMGLIMLSTGILVNIILAFSGKKQMFSSLHIVLGIVSLSIAPQSVITLLVATIITFAGIALSYRKKWDTNHLISILFYFGFMIFWSFNVDSGNNLYNISALAAIIAIALITLFIHYRRIYADSAFEVIPLLVHLINWLFLAVGLLKYAPDTDYAFIPLFLSGLLLFFLARYAKKLKINWLYAIDTLISQLMILLSVISLIKFDLSTMLIIFLVLIESIGFLVIIWREKEYLVHTIAFSISTLTSLALLFTGFREFSGSSSTELWIYAGIFSVAAGAISLYLLYISGTDFKEGLKGGLFKKKTLTLMHRINLFIQGAFIPVLLFQVYIFIMIMDKGSDYFGADTIAVPLFIALLAIKYRFKNLGMRITIIAYIVLVSLISTLYINLELDLSELSLLLYYLPVLLMSLAIIVYSMKKYKGIHKRLPGLYLLTIHLIVLSFALFEDISGLLTGAIWLLISLIYLFASNADKIGQLTESVLVNLKKGLLNNGYLVLFAFIGRFLFFDIHSQTIILGSVKAEYLLEIAAFIVMGLWFFINRSARLLDLLFLEMSLVFLLLVLFIEVPVTILPAVLMTLAIVLLLTGRFFKNSLSRLRIVSVFPAWIAAFLIAFVTSPYLSPSLAYTDLAWIMSAAGIGLQFVYLILFYNTHNMDKISLPSKLLKLEEPINKLVSGKNIFLYYPVFASILFFFIWSFSGAVLTALISFEALLILVLSIIVKEDSFRYTALGGIIAGIIRLVFFDLREAEIFVKAIAFIVVSVIMLLMNVLYNKFKDRA